MIILKYEAYYSKTVPCDNIFTSTDIDECRLEPCLNGGKCTDLIGSFMCSCVPGFTGTVCQTGNLDQTKFYKRL